MVCLFSCQYLFGQCVLLEEELRAQNASPVDKGPSVQTSATAPTVPLVTQGCQPVLKQAPAKQNAVSSSYVSICVSFLSASHLSMQ